MRTVEQRIFKAGSTTYYWSSRFFPKDVRADVLKLYSFVRVLDDYVDSLPQQTQAFYALRTAWQAAQADPAFDIGPARHDTVDQRVIKNIVGLARTHRFDADWITAFWNTMQSDLEGRRYQTLADSLAYVHGSAEIIGLMMARIFGLPPEAGRAARLQGRAMQWINFIRDIAEDNQLGRCYFPREDLDVFGLDDLQAATAQAHPERFAAFMRFELGRYAAWQAEAARGYKHMPHRLRVAVATASDMYAWTAEQIGRQPFAVFGQKVKPGRSRIVRSGLVRLFRTL